MSQHLISLVLGILALGCSRDSASSRESSQRDKAPKKSATDLDDVDEETIAARKPRRVIVRLYGAHVGPARSDGRVWDGEALVDPKVIQGLANVIGTINPTYAVAANVATWALNYRKIGSENPDPEGWAELREGTKVLKRYELKTQMDTFTPIWDDVEWTVTLTKSTRLIVDLWDNDEDDGGTLHLKPAYDPPIVGAPKSKSAPKQPLKRERICTVDLGQKALETVATKQEGVHVPVWDQCVKEVLTLKVSVVEVD